MRVLLLLAAGAMLSASEAVVLEIPPVTSSVAVKGQPVSITASATISRTGGAWGKEGYRLTVKADLSDLQQHLTELLSAQLNKDDKCGEQIQVQSATLQPVEPSALLTVHLRYERTLCAKAFGRQVSKKMVAGNGIVDVKLTPAVEANKTVRLTPEVTRMDADGSLGDLLRSGQLGERVKEKIEESVATSIQKAANVDGTVPPSIQSKVSIQTARFANGGAGRLDVVVTGDVKMTANEEKSLAAAIAARR